jgi:hypothetical protein
LMDTLPHSSTPTRSSSMSLCATMGRHGPCKSAACSIHSSSRQPCINLS